MGSLICSAWWRSFPEPSLSCRQPFRNEDFLLAVVIQERPAMCRHLIRRMGWDKKKWGDKSGAGRFGEHASRVSASGVSSRGLVSQRMSNVNLWPRRFRCGAPLMLVQVFRHSPCIQAINQSQPLCAVGSSCRSRCPFCQLYAYLG